MAGVAGPPEAWQHAGCRHCSGRCRDRAQADCARGLRDTARRCRANLSRILNYAALHGLCTADPAAPLARNDEVLPPPVVQHHAAITDKREGDRDGDAAERFGALLRAIDGYEGNRSVRNALNLIALVACRPGELRAMRWSWVTLDGDCPRIDFPAGTMKMREDFEVPLSKQAVAILTEQRGMTAWSDFVFPAVAPQSRADRPVLRSISKTTLNAALRRMGFLHDQHVAHGFALLSVRWPIRARCLTPTPSKRRWLTQSRVFAVSTCGRPSPRSGAISRPGGPTGAMRCESSARLTSWRCARCWHEQKRFHHRQSCEASLQVKPPGASPD
jgi:Phage integrase family